MYGSKPINKKDVEMVLVSSKETPTISGPPVVEGTTDLDLTDPTYSVKFHLVLKAWKNVSHIHLSPLTTEGVYAVVRGSIDELGEKINPALSCLNRFIAIDRANEKHVELTSAIEMISSEDNETAELGVKMFLDLLLVYHHEI